MDYMIDNIKIHYKKNWPNGTYVEFLNNGEYKMYWENTPMTIHSTLENAIEDIKIILS